MPLTDMQYLRKFCGVVRRYKAGDGVRMMTIKTNEDIFGSRFAKIVNKMGYELYTAVSINERKLFLAFYHRDDIDMLDRAHPIKLR
jgi:hypothetical protein